MSYPLSFKLQAIKYRKSHTAYETEKELQVSRSTVYRWERQLRAGGNLNNKPVIRPHKKVDPDLLKAYMKLNEDAYLKEIAQEFGCSITAIQKALKKHNIQRKKYSLPPKDCRVGGP